MNDCLLFERLTVRATSDLDASPLVAGEQVCLGRAARPPSRNQKHYLAHALAASLCSVELRSSKISTLGVPSQTFATIFSSSGYPVRL